MHSDRGLPVFWRKELSQFSLLELSVSSSGAGQQSNQNAHNPYPRAVAA